MSSTDDTFILCFKRALRGLPIIDLPNREKDIACVKAIHATCKGSASRAKIALANLAARRLSEDSDWAFDDFLLFAFLCSTRRFVSHAGFIETLISFRLAKENHQERDLISVARAILSDETSSVASIYWVVTCDVCGLPIQGVEHKRSALNQAITISCSSDANIFERIIAERCKEIMCGLSLDSDYPASVIAVTLSNRCCFIARFSYLILCSLVTFIWLFVAYFLLFAPQSESDLAGKLLSLGLIIPPVIVFVVRSKIEFFFNRLLLMVITGKQGYLAMRSLQDIK